VLHLLSRSLSGSALAVVCHPQLKVTAPLPG
jgi:hypothetical protein